MIEDDKNELHNLIENELNSNDKFVKPDFSQRTGREMLTAYLQAKFKQILAFDSLATKPVFGTVSYDFMQNFSSRLVQNPQKRIMIGITGESASGKSTICNAISDVIKGFNMPVTILSTDNYFNDISDLIKQYGSFDALRDKGYDIDAPESFQLKILKDDLSKLAQGINIKAPEYLPNGTGISVPESKSVMSNKIVIIEGIATMYKDIKDIFDVKIYVETDLETRKSRFMKRAYTERNQDLNNALNHWEYVVNAGAKYVKPARASADLILNGDTDMGYFRQLIEYIHAITNNFQSTVVK